MPIVGDVVMVLWLFLTPVMFAYARPARAAALGLLGSALFLPNGLGVDWPLLPPIGKDEVASIACLYSALWFAMPELRRARLGRGPDVLLITLAIGTVVAVFTNQDALTYGPIVVEGTKPTDVPARVIEEMLRWGVPFVLGRAFFTRSRDGRDLLVLFVVAGLVYSAFILVELRLSPQFHRWTYGFHQHGFHQTIRENGYRPMVYMRHGLHLALFMVMALTSAVSLVRLRHRFYGLPASWVAGYLAVILVLCKSVGSLGYAMFTAPIVLLTKPRMQMRAALGLAIFISLYPFVRGFEVIPLSWIHEVAQEAAGEERAKSLTGRLEVEIEVIHYTIDRIWFGWGSAGRAMPRDPVTGRGAFVFDGFWAVSLARGGVVQVASIFGLLLWPVFYAARHFSRIRAPADRVIVAGISLLVVINVVDLLPNSTTEGYLTLMSGALAGLVPGILREQSRARRPRVANSRPETGLAEGLLTAGRPSLRAER